MPALVRIAENHACPIAFVRAVGNTVPLMQHEKYSLPKEAHPLSPSMSASVVTDAVVLRLLNYSEADRIATLLTQTHGKVTAIAKGARSSRRRFGASLALFNQGQATLQEKPGQELWNLRDFYTAQGSFRLSSDMARFTHASYACELTREVCPPLTPEPALYQALCQFLHTLEEWPEAQPLRAEPLLAFEWNLWRAIGVEPFVTHCMQCQQTHVPSWWLDASCGGVLCEQCSPTRPSTTAHRVSQETLHELLQLRIQSLHPLLLSPEALQLARRFLLDMSLQHVGKELLSVDVIQQFNRSALA